MNSQPSLRLVSPQFSRWALKRLAVLSVVSLFPICVLAQDGPPPGGGMPPPDAAGGAAPDANQAQADNGGGGGMRRERGDGSQRRGFDPGQMMDNLRKRMEVTDDSEWALISDRLTTVFQLRMASGGFGGFGGGMRPGGGGGGRTRGGNAEADALREAIDNKLPDAEIKARMEKVREARKASEAKLDKAREDLRAVLTVRQEAIMLSIGMLN